DVKDGIKDTGAALKNTGASLLRHGRSTATGAARSFGRALKDGWSSILSKGDDYLDDAAERSQSLLNQAASGAMSGLTSARDRTGGTVSDGISIITSCFLTATTLNRLEEQADRLNTVPSTIDRIHGRARHMRDDFRSGYDDYFFFPSKHSRVHDFYGARQSAAAGGVVRFTGDIMDRGGNFWPGDSNFELLLRGGREPPFSLPFMPAPVASRDSVRIGGFCGFWGDSLTAAPQLVNRGRVEYLIGDYLAELTMSLLYAAKQRSGGKLGYATDFREVIKMVGGEAKAKGIKFITNAGGLNPNACKAAIERVYDERGWGEVK
ncbi:hypothetical protein FOZ62_000729, partial [Perkinsus olseni]